ncbi:acyltransferase family protein [Thalassococcus sp. CAU 1522]|uniref:Acyltransferase family protein n=1 Tax=Thalassococcus arenae TaxID=2851652 RepID=A0ABS6N4C3_9RHOB|nr:acyltransferase family protein [Thalassococcus arenae]MBV2358864.1 acyltransferase family protein [Thalassococcus arenae]
MAQTCLMAHAERYHGLDLLRAVAMLLGLVLHGALIYTAPSVVGDLPVASGLEPPQASPATWAVVIWIHQWRMPAFFLLAGFFAELVIARRGARAFLADRAVRILGALAVFSVLFTLIFARPWGVLDHMWFLWFLSLFCLTAWAAHGMGLRRELRAMAWPVQRLPRMIWLVVPVAALNLAGREAGIWHIIPDQIGQLDRLVGALPYFAAFVIGQMLFHTRDRLAELRRPRVWMGCIAAGALAYVLSLGLMGAEPWPVLPMAVFSAVASLGWTFGLIGLAQWAVPARSAAIDWLVRLSYPVYIFHLYLILGVSALLASAGLAQGWVIVLSAFVTFWLCVVLYYLLVKYTPLDWVLNGYGRAWFKWPWGTNGATKKAAP